MKLTLTDNTPFPLAKNKDGIYSLAGEHFKAGAFELLRNYQGEKISDLVKDHPGLIMYPPVSNGREGIGNDTLFDIIGNRSFATGNIVGFFKLEDDNTEVDINIVSRFDKPEGDEQLCNNFFLQYMLQRVNSSNSLNVMNVTTTSEENSLFDILAYIFPAYLKKALKQGMLRAYRNYNYDDDKVRGTINISRFIQKDIPFRGRISYSTREYSPDNNMTQLIRHTIEYIRSNSNIASILLSDLDTKKAVNSICQATDGTYAKGDRRKIIAANLTPVTHPYYTAYRDLQSLCLKILNHEKTSFGISNDKISGVIFDVAWLWEEYLSCVIDSYKEKIARKYIHSSNKEKKGEIYLFRRGQSSNCTEKGKGKIYPDFYSIDESDGIILDAKYKRAIKEKTKVSQKSDEDDEDQETEDKYNISIQRNDKYQMISYLHVAKASYGYFIYPTDVNNPESRKFDIGELNGHGGKLGGIVFPIPQGKRKYDEFCTAIEKSEEKFSNDLMDLKPKCN